MSSTPRMTDPSPALQVGDRVGRYTLARLLGRGGYGQVWEAVREDDGERVALKLARSEALRDEARLAAALRHRNLLDVFEVGDDAGWTFFAAELCPDGSVTRLAPLPPRAVADVGSGVARALAFAFRERSVVHCDVKPDNLLVGPDGEVRLADLGLATTGADGRSSAGTPGFLAPERRATGRVDPATDVFSLGVTLHVLSTGVDGAGARTVGLGDGPDEPPRAPDHLAALIEACTDPDPERRPTALALADALDDLALPGPGLRELVGRRRGARAALPLAGRRRELAAALGSEAPVLVTGPVGIGKTRLLREVAARWSALGRAVVTVDREVGSVGELLRAVAGPLGLGAADDGTLAESVPFTLRGRSSAVVIDTLGADPPTIETLARWRRDGTLVIAARRDAREEAGWTRLALGPLDQDEARAIVTAVASRRGAVVPEAQADALAEAFGGHPHAIELAAGRLGVWTVADLLRDRSLRHLRSADDGERGALEAALDGVWDELSPEARDTLAAASWFQASFSTDAVEQVGGPDAGALVAMLAARSMVSAEPGDRWRLLEVVRTYVEGRSERRPGPFVAWARSWGRHAEALTKPMWPLVAPDVFRELPNVVPAIDAAREAGDLEAALELVENLGQLHRDVPPRDAVAGPAERLAADRRLTAEQALRSRFHVVRGRIDVEDPRSFELAEAHLDRARALGDPHQEGRAEMLVADACTLRRDHAAAAGHASRAAALFPAGSVSWAHALVRQGLGLRSQPALADELTAQAAAVFRARAMWRWSAVAELNRSLFAINQGRTEDARRHCRAVLDSPHAQTSTKQGAFNNLGIAELRRGDEAAALGAFEAAWASAEHLRQPSEIARAACNVAWTCLGRDDPRALQAAERVWQVGARERRGEALATRAMAAWFAGDDARARDLAVEATALSAEFAALRWLLATDAEWPDAPLATLLADPSPDTAGARAGLATRAGRTDEVERLAATLDWPADRAVCAHARRRYPPRP